MYFERIPTGLIPGDLILNLEISCTMVFLKVEDYNGDKSTVVFYYQSLEVELLVYCIGEENQETLLHTEQRITLPVRPWTNGRVD